MARISRNFEILLMSSFLSFVFACVQRSNTVGTLKASKTALLKGDAEIVYDISQIDSQRLFCNSMPYVAMCAQQLRTSDSSDLKASFQFKINSEYLSIDKTSTFIDPDSLLKTMCVAIPPSQIFPKVEASGQCKVEGTTQAKLINKGPTSQLLLLTLRIGGIQLNSTSQFPFENYLRTEPHFYVLEASMCNNGQCIYESQTKNVALTPIVEVNGLRSYGESSNPNVVAYVAEVPSKGTERLSRFTIRKRSPSQIPPNTTTTTTISNTNSSNLYALSFCFVLIAVAIHQTF